MPQRVCEPDVSDISPLPGLCDLAVTKVLSKKYPLHELLRGLVHLWKFKVKKKLTHCSSMSKNKNRNNLVTVSLSKGKRCTSNDTHLGKPPDRINPITIWKSWEWKEPDGGLTAWPLRASHTSLQLVIKGLPTSTLPLAWPVLDSNRLWLMELWITSTKTLTNLKVMNTRYKEPQLVTQKIVSL